MLLIHRPTIVHLSGHATKSDGIIFEDDNGSMKPISLKGLVQLFQVFEDTIKLTVLNMCHTQKYAAGLSGVVDYVIGMKGLITDREAIVFSAALYKGLSFGLSIRMAFDLAVNQMILQGLSHSDAPLLRVRDDADNSDYRVTDTPNVALAGWEKGMRGIESHPIETTRSLVEKRSKDASGKHGNKKDKDRNSSVGNRIAKLQREMMRLGADLESLKRDLKPIFRKLS